VDGGIVDIPMFGSVQQRVDPERFTVVNTTTPDHRLHPGNVHRSVVQDGDDFYVVTHGYGTGVFPGLNELTANTVWGSLDHNIRHEINPYTPVGYPMDEMNALENAGSSSGQENLGIASNRPMEFSVTRPPIFPR
jgi:hypothetical protein